MESYCKILIIDDEIIMRQGIKYLLDWEKEGFQIAGEASGGREGLELVEELQPHIILCDMVMSGMDGVEFTEIVKKKYPNIQIIILSGYDNFEYVRSSLMNGASDYILKPMLKPETLLETLRRTAKKIPGFRFAPGKNGQRGKPSGAVSSGDGRTGRRAGKSVQPFLLPAVRGKSEEKSRKQTGRGAA